MLIFEKSLFLKNHKWVESNINVNMTLVTSLVVLFNCYATADILKKLLQQCFLFFIVVVIPGQ